jgi:hypothetical protein
VRIRAAFIGLAAGALLLGWQTLTVHYNYGGNWTALYMIGPRTPVPQSISSERLYIFENTSGYDGQSFHVMAHDPWIRRNTPAEVEIAPFRYARILAPALAWMLAFGRDGWIDRAYFAVIAGFGFLGAYWVALYAMREARSAVWGLAFLLSPAALTSADRMTVDIALAALCAGFAVYADRAATTRERIYESPARWPLAIVLACALLTRETAWLLFGAYEIFLIARRRWIDARFTVMAAIPAIAWNLYVAARSGESAMPPRVLGWIPLAGFIDRLAHRASYRLPPGLSALAISFDYIALAGIGLALILAAGMAIAAVRGRRWTPLSSAICAFALAAVFLRGPAEWADAYAFGRIFAPLLLLIAMYSMPAQAKSRIWLGLAPTLLVDSRIALNLGKQAVGIMQGLLHSFGAGA